MSQFFEGDVRPTVDCKPNSGRTKQSFKAQVNINNIVAKYQRTGMLEHVRQNPGVFADVSSIGDYHGMVSKIRTAKESFERLTSDLRSRFNDDPAELIAFVSDASNRDEAIRLGLVNKPSVKAPKPSDPVIDPTRVIAVKPNVGDPPAKEVVPTTDK